MMRRVPAFCLFAALAVSGAVAQDAVPPVEGVAARGPYSAIIERPLFDPDRRPVEPPPADSTAPTPVVETGPPPETPLYAVLLGVVTGEDRALAVVQRGDGKLVRLSKGEAVDGWKLVSIGIRSVDFERGGVRQKLELAAPGQSSGMMPPVVPPQPE